MKKNAGQCLGGGAGRQQKHKHGLPADNATCKFAQVPPDLLHPLLAQVSQERHSH